MKQKLESILIKGKILFLAGLMFLTPLVLGAQTLKQYVEAKIGAIVPLTEQKQDYEPSYLVGGAYGFNKGRLGLEAGLDYFQSSGEYIKTNSILPRLNVSYSPRKQKAKVKPYLTAGANLLSEFSTIDIPEFNVHDKVKNTTFGLEAGVGVTLFNRINGRVSYTIMPTSKNVKGMLTTTFGFRFLFGKKK